MDVDLTLRDSQLLDNTAQSVGALCLFCACLGTIEGCTFAGNIAEHDGGAIRIGKVTHADVIGCTFYGNGSAAGTIMCGEYNMTFHNAVIAFGVEGPAMMAGSATLSCCDLYGNPGGDWTYPFDDQYGINGNISEDPLFCDPENGDFTLECTSPCAPFSPPNEECDLIGAWPVGCGASPVTKDSWGGVKALFR